MNETVLSVTQCDKLITFINDSSEEQVCRDLSSNLGVSFISLLYFSYRRISKKVVLSSSRKILEIFRNLVDDFCTSNLANLLIRAH